MLYKKFVTYFLALQPLSEGHTVLVKTIEKLDKLVEWHSFVKKINPEKR